MRHILVTCLFVMAGGFAARSHAAVIVTTDAGVATPNMPGFRTFTVTATSLVPGELIYGVDFIGDPSTYGPIDPAWRGFIGPLNQVNPVGLPTVFTDFNVVFSPFNADVLQDSQFKYNSNTDVISPAGYAIEGPYTLRAFFGRQDHPLGQSIQFAQLVIPFGGIVDYRGMFWVLRDGVFITVPEVTGIIISVPPQPFINVRGNAESITNGDSTPTRLDNTDFGTVQQGSLQVRSYTILSTGLADLVLGTPTITGPFSLVGTFPSSIPAGDSATFTLGLDTSAPGSFTGSISFATNIPVTPKDDPLDPFGFSLAATVVPEPASAVLIGAVMQPLAVFQRRRKPQ